MKVWEVSRRPVLVFDENTPVVIVRAEMRRTEEPIAVLVKDLREEKFSGYLTRREVIQVTSHYSNLRGKDLALTHPAISPEDDIGEAIRLMKEAGVTALPVIRDEKVEGIITVNDIINTLYKSTTPIATTVNEVSTLEGIDELIVTPDTPITKVWSDFIYKGLLGKIVVRSKDERIPIGIITPRELIETSRWFFHRESERGLKSVAKVRTIMLRGVPIATPDTPIEYVAKVMAVNDYPLLPVINDKGEVVAVVTVFDVAKAYLEGAKPRRVRPPRVIPLPIPITEKERRLYQYQSTTTLLEQVVVPKPAVSQLSGITLRDIAREELPAITINDTVEHARRVMIRYKTNYLIVIDDKGHIAGVITKWSMLKAIGLKGPLWKRRTHDRYFIDYIMETNIPRLPEDTTIEEACLYMVDNRADVVIVVDKNDNIKGFVTKDDIVNAYLSFGEGRAKVQNVMTPKRISVVHPHHSLYHVVKRMETFYLDALTVAEGSRILGVISANRLPFIALEDRVEGIKSRRLIWVRKLVKGAARRGRYVKVTPLLAIDALVRVKDHIEPEDDLINAIKLMTQNNVDGIPVVTKSGELMGTVTKTDIVRELARTAKRRRELRLPLRVEKT